MADFQPVKYSPLSALERPASGIELTERLYVGKLNLRGDSRDDGFLGAVEQCLGTALPLEANTVNAGERCTVFWLGPDEWLVHTEQDGQQTAAAALRSSLAGRHTAVTDVTDYYLVIRMRGERARAVLAKGTPFDVHPRVFLPGRCAQTRYGHASILLHCVDEAPTYDIQVRWSFAEYLWDYLVDGSRE